MLSHFRRGRVHLHGDSATDPGPSHHRSLLAGGQPRPVHHETSTGRQNHLCRPQVRMATFKCPCDSCDACDQNTIESIIGENSPERERSVTSLIWFAAYFHVFNPQSCIANKYDWALFRITTICGYLPSDLVGKSGFNFINGEDLPWTTMAQRHSEKGNQLVGNQ